MSTKIVNGVELGSDGKEWAKTDAGFRFVDEIKARADGFHGLSPWFHGWAVRDAFVAGAEWQEQRMRTVIDHMRGLGASWHQVEQTFCRGKVTADDFKPVEIPKEPSRLPAWVKEGAKFRLYDRRLYHVHGVVNGIAVLKEWWKHKQRWNYSCEDWIFFDVAEQQKTIKIVKKVK